MAASAVVDQHKLWRLRVGHCRPRASANRLLNLGVSFTAVRSLTLLSLADSYQFAFNRLDIMLIHGLRGVVDEESDRGRQANRFAVG
jgi:hypothetical protein